MDVLILALVIPFCLIILYYLAKVSYSIWWKPKWLEKKLKLQGIKGTPYKPLIGDMKDLIRHYKDAWSKPINLNHQIAARVDPFTHSVVQKHGKVSFCWMGPTPRLVLQNPEMVKEVLQNKQGHFQKPYLNPLILILARGITTLEGEKWAKHRRIINPAFHMEKLRSMVPVMATVCNEFTERWKNLAGEDGSNEVDIWSEFQNLTSDVISRTAFGSSYEEGRKIFELQKELMKLVIEAMQTVYIPGFRYIPTRKNRRRKQLNKMIMSQLTELIQKREKDYETEGYKADDLLGLLLQSNNQNSGGMTLEEVIEECKVFYFAGQETTASLLTWTAIVLAMHPDWQEKAREEVLQICGRLTNNITFEAVNHLKTLTMILHEVLRLYPPVIAQYQHVYKETRIGDILIPAGVDVTLPTLLVHHDPEFWGDDVEDFRPERFSEGAANASKDQLAFFPFGWGPRTCMGQNFALLEAKVVLSMILQKFSFELSPSYSHAPHTVATLQPQHGAHIFLRPF